MIYLNQEFTLQRKLFKHLQNGYKYLYPEGILTNIRNIDSFFLIDEINALQDI